MQHALARSTRWFGGLDFDALKVDGFVRVDDTTTLEDCLWLNHFYDRHDVPAFGVTHGHCLREQGEEPLLRLAGGGRARPEGGPQEAANRPLCVEAG